MSAAKPRVNNLEAKLVSSISVQSPNNEEQEPQRRRLKNDIFCKKILKRGQRVLNAMSARLKVNDEEHARHSQELQDHNKEEVARLKEEGEASSRGTGRDSQAYERAEYAGQASEETTYRAEEALRSVTNYSLQQKEYGRR